MNTHH